MIEQLAPTPATSAVEPGLEVAVPRPRAAQPAEPGPAEAAVAPDPWRGDPARGQRRSTEYWDLYRAAWLSGS